MKLYMVNIELLGLGVVGYDLHDREVRVFSSEEKAKKFLLDNGFVFGRRATFEYKGDEAEWFHSDEFRQALVDGPKYLLTATITETEVDTEEEFKWNHFILNSVYNRLLGKKDNAAEEPPFSFEEEDNGPDAPATEDGLDPDDAPFTGLEGNTTTLKWVPGDAEEEYDDGDEPFV